MRCPRGSPGRKHRRANCDLESRSCAAPSTETRLDQDQAIKGLCPSSSPNTHDVAFATNLLGDGFIAFAVKAKTIMRARCPEGQVLEAIMDFKVASCRSVTMILAAFPGMVLLPVPVKLGQLGTVTAFATSWNSNSARVC